MLRKIAFVAFAVALLAWSPLAALADEPTSEQCAAALQKSTVTVRVRLHPEAKAADDHAGDETGIERDPLKQVTVCSGVAVAERFVVTTAFAAADSQIRITLAGGEQAEAKLRVLDEFSGLALLEVDDLKLPNLEFAEQSPVAGGWVMTAAAWGAEQPLVSVGIVGGVNRAIKGYVYPPLLQCDIRPAETSSGAGIIDRSGRLLGIIVAADSPEVHRGWLYAVPVSHVQRLLRTRSDRTHEDSVVVLKRRRPSVGVELETTDAGISVRRVVPGSPAEKAGIEPGDRIVTAEGTNVRSLYDALRPTLYKQPGDTMSFQILRGEEKKTIDLVLGGGVELPTASLEVLGKLVAPKIDLSLNPKRNGGSSPQAADVTIREVYSAQPVTAENKDAALASEKLRVLEKATERYRMVIEQQQRELSRMEEERREQIEQLESLKSQLESLKKKPAGR
jgi:S1-C subfamily serine protease